MEQKIIFMQGRCLLSRSSIKLQVGGVILRQMPLKWWKRDLFHVALNVYQKWLLKMIAPSLSTAQRYDFARVSHVELCLGGSLHNNPDDIYYDFLNVTWPDAKISTYSNPQIKNMPSCIYLDPKFNITKNMQAGMREFSAAMVQPKKRAYDWVQLLSYLGNLIFWKLKPENIGKEISKTLNIPGGHQVCSSGAAGALRYGEFYAQSKRKITLPAKVSIKLKRNLFTLTAEDQTKFFPGYDFEMVSPCSYCLSSCWNYANLKIR